LLAHCRDHLARYKYPRRLQIVPELPKGPTGKILKSILIAQAQVENP
jgi:long-chain acyl-CoA synthetase